MPRKLILRNEQGIPLDKVRRELIKGEEALGAYLPTVSAVRDKERGASPLIMDATNPKRPLAEVVFLETLAFLPFGLRSCYRLVNADVTANVYPCDIAMAMTVRGGLWGTCTKLFVVSDAIDPDDLLKRFGGAYSLLDSGIVPANKLTFLRAEHRFIGSDNMVYAGPGVT